MEATPIPFAKESLSIHEGNVSPGIGAGAAVSWFLIRLWQALG
jgi:hypothetical protein